jgi:hypothetical protein
VLLGNGDGTFGAPRLIPVGSAPNEVQVGDFNGDGIPDLVTANYGSDNVSVLLGHGDGTFGPQQTFPAGSGPASVAVADVDGDGNLDLVVANRNASTVQVLHGKGDGTFGPPVPFGVGKNRYSLAVADLNGDGSPDLVTTRLLQNKLIVQLGNGTGNFEPGQAVTVGAAPTSVVVADVNGDGRPDLVTTNSGDNSVSVLLGNGDGTFSVQHPFAVGQSPRAVAVADLNGDGIPDLAVANDLDATVSVLLGKGDGTFGPQRVFAVGQKPYALAVADVNGDGRPDLVVANAAGDTVGILLGKGDGTFGSQETFATGRTPLAVKVADVNGDGIPDLVTANAFDNTVSLLLGKGNGTFLSPQVFPVGSRPYSVAAVDVNGDGILDLVTANYGDHNASVLLGRGNGSFQNQQTFPTDQLPVLTVVADVNGDGRPDLVTAGNHDRANSVLLGRGDGSFQPVTASTGVGLRATPFLADLDGDGIPDSVVLDRSGNILFRKGLPGASNAFAPPVILNPGRPARDITVVRVGVGSPAPLAIAAADAHYDPTLSANQFVFAVSLYTVSRTGAVERRTAFATPALPARLRAADLTGDQLDDLIAANALDGSVTIALQTAPGVFAAPITMPAGVAPSDIAVADVNGDGRPDVVVSDQASGDVTVVLNDAAHQFRESLRFRASTEPAGLTSTQSSPLAVSSVAQSVSVVAGDFTGLGRVDLLVVNRGAHSFTVLAANGNSGFTDPQLTLTKSTSDGLRINERPGAVVAGDFNRDGRLDLAVLMEDTGEVWIFTNEGDGAFRHTFSIPVGDQATGLSTVAGSRGDLLDLLVGNGFGDVLHLEGRGDGTFQIRGSRVSLSVVPDLFGAGQAGVLVGNQQNNRVTVQAQTSGGTQFSPVQTLAATQAAQLAPGDVHWFVLDKGATLPDAVVVSSGSNAVVVYRTMAVRNGALVFDPVPQTIFVGTAPASVTVADINGDGIQDLLIANQGSNDVSVVFGSFAAGGVWVGKPGPRLKSGGAGPIAVTVRDMNGDGIPDLVVTNGGSGTLTLLPGVGQGFFDDRQPRTLFNVGDALVQPPTFTATSGVGYAVTAGGELVRFDLDHVGEGVQVVFSGQGVLAARALDNGLVVVALAGGAVEILAPDGAGLRVLTELQAQGGVPVLPSALEVLQTKSGQLQILVSSQGSDTIFVFAAAAAASLAVKIPGPGEGVQPVNGPAPVAASPAPVSITLPLVNGTNVTGGTAGSGGTGGPVASTTGALSLGLTAGLALISSTGHDNGTGKESSVSLVPIQGNTYATVAVLDFGSQDDEEAGGGEGRKPWLSLRHAFGDTTDLMRFVIGQEEAVQDYRRMGEARFPEGSNPPLADPWKEDLFQLRPGRTLMGESPDDPPREGQPEGGAEDSRREDAGFWESYGDDPLLSLPAAVGANGATYEAIGLVLAGLLLAQAHSAGVETAKRKQSECTGFLLGTRSAAE